MSAVSVCKDYLPWREADPPLAIDECRWYEWRDMTCDLNRELCEWKGHPYGTT